MFTENTSKVLVWIGVGVIGIGVILFCFRDSFFNFTSPIDSDKVGQFGDFIGGVAGSIWALAGVFLFYIALNEQKKATETSMSALNQQIQSLELQKKEFESQLRLQEEQLDISKKDADSVIIDRLYFDLIREIDSISYRKSKSEAGKVLDNEIIYTGTDALFNFDNSFRHNRNTVLNHLNGILVSFDHLISMTNKVKYKYSFIKEVMLTKIYFLYYTKILWPVYEWIYLHHKDDLFSSVPPHPDAEVLFGKYERLAIDTYNHLLERNLVGFPSEEKIAILVDHLRPNRPSY